MRRIEVPVRARSGSSSPRSPSSCWRRRGRPDAPPPTPSCWRSIPADGQVVETAPAEVVLRFSEQVSLTGGSAAVLDDEAAVVSGEARVVDESVVIALPPGLGDGTYTVTWQVISADSHRISGASVFHVGAPSAGGGAVIDAGGDEAGWALRFAASALTRDRLRRGADRGRWLVGGAGAHRQAGGRPVAVAARAGHGAGGGGHRRRPAVPHRPHRRRARRPAGRRLPRRVAARADRGRDGRDRRRTDRHGAARRVLSTPGHGVARVGRRALSPWPGSPSRGTPARRIRSP